MIDMEQVQGTVARAAAVRTQLAAMGRTEAEIGPLGADLADLHEAAGHLRSLVDALVATPPYDRDRLGDTLADLQTELAHIRWHVESALPHVATLAEAYDD